MNSPHHRFRAFFVGVGLMIALSAGTSWAIYSKSTELNSDGGGGTVSITTKNSDDTNATWQLSGLVNYAKGAGMGGGTYFSFSTTTDCMFGTFSPSTGYNDALVDAELVLFTYDTTTFVQTERYWDHWFGNSAILTAPMPETRDEHPDAGRGNYLVAAGNKLRYKLKGGYWPSAPNPFVVLKGTWTNDL